MSPDKPSRTFIGSVVCVDLVGYSTKSTAQQGAIKKLFNGLLAQALSGVPAEDRIILDTGDGAAISFLGDPEASLAVALELRKVMCERAVDLGATSDGLQGPVRIGINLGPVKLAMDLNGYPKIIGDGINVAERVMGFAKPGQVVASRSFHDMVSRLSDGNAALFRYEGVRTDKNVRDHEIYVVAAPAEGKAPVEMKAAAPAEGVATPVAASSPGALTGFLQDRYKVGFAALLLVAVIAAEALLLATRTKDPARIDSAAATQPAPVSAPTPIPAVPSTPPASVPEPPPKVAAIPAPATPAPKVAEPRPADTKASAKPEPRTETKPAAPVESRVPPAKEASREAEKAAAAKPAPPPAKPAPEPEKTTAAKAPAKSPATEPPKAAPMKPAESPKTAARKPDEPPRFAAPAPTAPVPEPPKEEPPKPVVAPTPTSTVTLLARAPVEFPVEAAARRIDSGMVRARLTISAAGTVSNVQILDARPRRWFDSEATRALKLFKFNPGLEGRTYEVEIEFQR